MRFLVSSGLLYKNLQHISGVVGSNTVMPILESFLFVIEHKSLTAVGTDLETTLKVSMDIQSDSDGHLCVQAKVLMDYLKNLPEQPITFDINTDNFEIDITSEQGKYKIKGEDASTYPAEPKADNVDSFTMSSTELSDGLGKTLVAVSTDDLRPQMSGVYFDLSKSNMTLVATDAHRLVRCIKTDVHSPIETSFIVPRKAVNLLKNTLNTPSEVTISFNENHFFVVSDSVQMSCRLVDAKFPDYKVVIPADNPYRLTVPKSDFVGALRRVSVFANKTTNQVILDIAGNNLHIYAQDKDYAREGNERMNCEYDGDDMKISFNAKLMLELILVIDSDDLVFELSTPNRAGLIKPVEKRANEDLLILLMPLMIAN